MRAARAILYSSLAGRTKAVAHRLAGLLRIPEAQVFNVRTASAEALPQLAQWIICLPTYGMGELDHQLRRFLARCPADAFAGAHVWLVVLGDQRYHGKTFAEALLAARDAFTALGAEVAGDWPADSYQYETSRAVDPHGNFCGLVLDEVNQPEQTDRRMAEWVQRMTRATAGGVS